MRIRHGEPVSGRTLERHIPWPRDRQWRPGEPMTVTEHGLTITYRLRGVMRDADPASAHATLTLEPVRTVEAESDETEEPLSAAG
jgi:hypothetical protein